MINKDKLVIFDWGGIVFNFQAEEELLQMWQNVTDKLGIKVSKEFLQRWRDWDFDMTTKDTRKINSDFQRVLKLAGINADNSTIKHTRLIVEEEIKKSPRHEKVADFINKLIISDRCLVGVLSNLSVCYAPAIATQLPLSAFDFVWLSFELGCEKPNDEIYKKVEAECQIKPENILFFDDSSENIAAAQKRGWNVFLIDETLDEDLRVKQISQTIDNFLSDKKD